MTTQRQRDVLERLRKQREASKPATPPPAGFIGPPIPPGFQMPPRAQPSATPAPTLPRGWGAPPRASQGPAARVGTRGPVPPPQDRVKQVDASETPISLKERASELGKDLIPVYGTYRQSKRLVRDWDQLGGHQRALGVGAVTLSALGDVTLFAGGIGLGLKAIGRGATVATLTTSNAGEASKLLQLANTGTKATKGSRVGLEVVANTGTKHLENVRELASTLPSRQVVNIKAAPTPEGIQGAIAVDDVLRANKVRSTAALHVDSPLTRADTHALVAEAQRQNLKSIRINHVIRPTSALSKADATELAKILGTTPERATKILSTDPKAVATTVKSMEKEFKAAGIQTRVVNEKLVRNKEIGKIKLRNIALEPPGGGASLPSQPTSGGRVITAVRPGTGVVNKEVLYSRQRAATVDAVPVLRGAYLTDVSKKVQATPKEVPSVRPAEIPAIRPVIEPQPQRKQQTMPTTVPATDTITKPKTEALTKPKAQELTNTLAKPQAQTTKQIATAASTRRSAAVPFILPNGKSLPPGIYPRDVIWPQGKVFIKADLDTGKVQYFARKDTRPISPEEGLKVLTYDKTAPRMRTFTQGFVNVRVTPRSLGFIKRRAL